MSFLLRWAAPAPGHNGAGHQLSEEAEGNVGGGGTISPEVARVRTLLSRVHTCTVAKDRREALSELAAIEDAGNFMTIDGLRILMQTATNATAAANNGATKSLSSAHDSSSSSSSSTDETMGKILEILSNITDEKIVPDAFARGAFLQELMQNLPLILPQLAVEKAPVAGGNDGSGSSSTGGASLFWTRYRVVQLLQRLLEHDTEGLQKALLQCHGVAALVDLLHDDTNGGVLRNEGLALVSLLTASNSEIQTILSFENGFDTLFSIIRKEMLAAAGGGGGDGAGAELIIVVDCLAAVLNILRNNKATQKYFLETGSAKLLAPLLTDKLENLGGGASSSSSSARSPLLRNPLSAGSSSPQPGGGATSSSLSKFSTMANNIVYSAVAIVSMLLRGGDGNGEGSSVRATLAHSCVVGPLATVALSQLQTLDNGTCAEAATVLASILAGSKPSCEQLLAAKIVVPTAVLSQSSHLVTSSSSLIGIPIASAGASALAMTTCSVPWLALWLALEQRTPLPSSSSGSTAAAATHHANLIQSMSFKVLASLLSPSGGVAIQAASLLTKNLTPVRPPGIGRLQPENHCGFLLSSFLFCSTTSAHRSAAALVLDLIIQVPQVQEQLLHVQWPANPPAAAADTSAPCPANFFSVYCRSVATLLRQQASGTPPVGAHASSSVPIDAAAVSALLRPIITWLTYCGKTHQLLLSDLVVVNTLVEWPTQTRMSAHAKILCSSVAALLLSSLVASLDQSKAATVLASFSENLTLAKWQSWYDEVVASSEWKAAVDSSPPTNSLFTIFYDKTARLLVEESRTTYLPKLLSQQQSLQPTTALGRSVSPLSAPQAPPAPTTTTIIHHRTLSDEDLKEGTPAAAPAVPTPPAASPISDPAAVADASSSSSLEHHRLIDAEVRRLLSTTAAQNAELASLRKQLQDQQAAHLAAVAKIQAQLSAKSDECVSLAEQLAATKLELENVKADHAAVVDAYDENLRRKDEETQQLASTLSMLEKRLSSSDGAVRELDEVRKQLETVTGERDELLILVAELDEEREVLKNASAIVTTPTNLPTDVED